MSYDNYQHDDGGAYEGDFGRKGGDPEQAKSTFTTVLREGSAAVNNPNKSQDKGQDALWSWATKKTGINLTNLPKLRISTKPGKWADSKKWKTKALRRIARKAKSEAPKVVFAPAKYHPAVKSMLSNIKAAKRALDAAKPLAEAQGGAAAATYQKLSLRWYEAASGLLRNAVVKKTGQGVNMGLRLNIYTNIHRGVSFTAWNAAFAKMGGARYARALNKDARAFLATLKTKKAKVQRGARSVQRSAESAQRAVVTSVDTVQSSPGMGLLLGAGVVLLGAVAIKRLRA